MSHSLLERRLPLFPRTTSIEMQAGRTGLTIAGCSLEALAQQHATPLYLYDRATLDAAVAAYRAALGKHYPGETGLTYAGKAYLCTALAQWAGVQNLAVDCTGAGEITIAKAGGLRREQILVHGVNKSPADLDMALAQAGTLVVDNLAELRHLAAIFHQTPAPRPDLWLRLRPGTSVNTHAYIQTGQPESKFGMDAIQARQAAALCREHGLPLVGLHFHLGSQFHDPAPVAQALQAALQVISSVRIDSGVELSTLCPGGGLGVAYNEDDLPHPDIEAYVRFLASELVAGCRQLQLTLPRLILEPGRSLVALAGVCLYRVGAIKQAGGRRWLLLDGGLADNPRPALYHARYSCLPVAEPERLASGPAWLGGPYCESGDVLIEDLPLPDIQPGELVAVPVSGAYQISMSSNYNGACRPAVLWLENGQAHVIQEREQPQHLLQRDRRLPSHEPRIL